MENGGIVGAVRLCFEQGYSVLRGMYVLKEKQGMGVGSALLVAAVEELGNRECWCIPYTHLIGFYGQAGFVKVTRRSAPEFLQDRLANYKATGKSVVAMVRNQK
ncbi:MAG: GNAT family N-acetyltransferase [Deltaproteobacteria bacterium]|nr:GNAT family N-acetyltransferase [Deltaproteobacteria bacterium]